MATIRPFTAIGYTHGPDKDISRLIAPPYDVLDEKGKAELQLKHPNNIVNIDLPHLPPKTVGPDSTYEQANSVLQQWIAGGVLNRWPRPAFYPYSQSYQHNGRTFHRRGFFTLVKLAPFGTGQIVPHEQTYKGPIEDRLKLMRATGVQLSPIFGLYSDPKGKVVSRLFERIGKPELTGTLGDVRNDLWSVSDAQVENDVIDLMRHQPVYIADGHHRYTTALQYQTEIRAAHGGNLPDAHPANWCLFVLVSMQDDGLLIHPTHRLIGGLRPFHIEAFRSAIADHFEVTDAVVGHADVATYLRQVLPKQPPHTFGLFDGATRKVHQLRLKNLDVLRTLEPLKSDAWRRLDVAILQRYLLDTVLQPEFASGELTKGYTASEDEVAPMVDGHKYQIGLLLQSTPLRALEDLGKHGEVMPQKSTYFYPKLATGMVINPIK